MTYDPARPATLRWIAPTLVFGALLLPQARSWAEPPALEADRTSASPWASDGRHGAFVAPMACDACHDDFVAAREVVRSTQAPYESRTLDADVRPPSRASAWCLQCHDGLIASEAAGTPIGLDGLQNDHPVSLDYDASLVARDGGLRDPSYPVVELGLAGSIDTALLDDGRLECTSCHTFHGEPGTKLVRGLPGAQRNLCLVCHDK